MFVLDSTSTHEASEGVRPLPPGPKGWPVIGSLPGVWKDPLTFFSQGRDRHGDTALFHFGPYRYVLIHKPEDVRHVLVRNHANYHKSPTYIGLKLVMGDGLVTSEGDFWKRQRKLAQPAFHHRALVGLAEVMTRCTSEMLEDWSKAAGSGGLRRDLHEEMMRLTLRIVGHTLFSTELGDDAEQVGPAITVCLEHANRTAESLFVMPKWVPTPRNLRFQRQMRILDRMVEGIIEARRGGQEPAEPDLLSLLMSATDESGTDRMTDKQLRDEVMTLALAGHETTANTLTWTFVLLARHPSVLARLRAEVDSVLAGRVATVEDLKSMPYTNQVLDESMRIYPSVWNVERVALEDDVLDGYHIPKGTIVAVCPWTLHRHPKRWPSPKVFDPERFTDEAIAARDRWDFLPFGAGPRVCIGNAFAKMEAKLLLTSILARWDIELDPKAEIVAEAGITLRPKHGVPVRLTPRSPSNRAP